MAITATPGFATTCTASWRSGACRSRTAALDDDGGRGYELSYRTIHLMRGLLRSMMAQSAKVEAFKYSRHPKDALHAKYDTETGGLVVSDAGWGHLQIDATSLYLLMLAQMISSGLDVIWTRGRSQLRPEPDLLYRTRLPHSGLRHLGARRQAEPRQRGDQRQQCGHGQSCPGSALGLQFVWRQGLAAVRLARSARQHCPGQHHSIFDAPPRIQHEGDGCGAPRRDWLPGVCRA